MARVFGYLSENDAFNAIEVLTMLKREVSIGILTNGFTETQRIKLRESGIGQWIDFVQTSEEIREAKPNRAFFTKAFESCKTHAQNCIYIGDNLKTDVEGGMNAGICTSHFNYSNISELSTSISNHSLFGGSYKTLMSWLDSLHA
ncbi:HAD-IA family hydrolase [Bacteroidia bacterium]|nr:HAD-IA family hydrolase [Bacteroidia bacterium]